MTAALNNDPSAVEGHTKFLRQYAERHRMDLESPNVALRLDEIANFLTSLTDFITTPEFKQAAAKTLNVRYVDAQPDSGPHKPAIPAHLVIEDGPNTVSTVPLASALAAVDWPVSEDHLGKAYRALERFAQRTRGLAGTRGVSQNEIELAEALKLILTVLARRDAS